MPRSGPDEWWVISSVGICAAIVPIGVAPGVDKPRVGGGGATDHRRFRLEVALGGAWKIILIGAEE